MVKCCPVISILFRALLMAKLVLRSPEIVMMPVLAVPRLPLMLMLPLASRTLSNPSAGLKEAEAVLPSWPVQSKPVSRSW